MDLKQLENELSYYDLPSKRLDEIKNIAKRFAASQVERIDTLHTDLKGDDFATKTINNISKTNMDYIETQKQIIIKELS